MPANQLSPKLSKERRYIFCTSSGCQRSSSVPCCHKKEVTLSVQEVGASEPTQSPVVKRKKIHYLYWKWVPANQLSPQLSKEKTYIICTSSGCQRSSPGPSCQKREDTLSVLAVSASVPTQSRVVKRKKIHYLYKQWVPANQVSPLLS